MAPEHIAAVAAASALIDKIGTWPLGTLLFTLIIGPWILAFLLNRGQAKQFDAVKKMYENNVSLVEGYQALGQDFKKVTADHQGLIMANTAAMTKLTESVNTNQFCPTNRTRKKTIEVVDDG